METMRSEDEPIWCRNVIAARMRPGEQVVVGADDPLRVHAERLAAAARSSVRGGPAVRLPPSALEKVPAELRESVGRIDIWIGMWQLPRLLTAAGNDLLTSLRAVPASPTTSTGPRSRPPELLFGCG
jgi:hypothetical protein